MSIQNGAFGAYETPAFQLGSRVRIKATGQSGSMRAFLGWEPPIILYGLLLDGEEMSGWLSQSEIEPC